MRSRGPDTARSSRHRVVAEAVWVPTALLPSPHVTWTAITDDRIRYEVALDGDTVPVELRIDGAGRVTELTMRRHGNTGVPDWGLLPYGFACSEERTFGGCTIPTQFRGGWWYGTERFEPDAATDFAVTDARYA